jgi:hypothetical protein
VAKSRAASPPGHLRYVAKTLKVVFFEAARPQGPRHPEKTPQAASLFSDLGLQRRMKTESDGGAEPMNEAIAIVITGALIVAAAIVIVGGAISAQISSM